MTLPSGSLRVRVYAGVDPLSGKRLYLTETVPAGPRALAGATKVRTRLLGQIDEQRNPRTRATFNQLMDRYLDVLDVEVTTRARYAAAIRLHVRPLLGELPVSRLSGETPSTRRCAAAASTAMAVLSSCTLTPPGWTLSGALSRAVRWRWIT